MSRLEEWKDIKGYEGKYMISNCGNIKSLERLSKHNRSEFQKIKEKIW